MIGRPLSTPSPPAPGLTLKDRYHTMAAFLGLADDEHLYERALIVGLNHLDCLLAIIERLTGNTEDGITGAGGGR